VAEASSRLPNFFCSRRAISSWISSAKSAVRARAGDHALGVVDDEPRGHGAEPLEGATVAAESGAHALVPDELHVLVARKTERHHERSRAADLARGGVAPLGAGGPHPRPLIRQR